MLYGRHIKFEQHSVNIHHEMSPDNHFPNSCGGVSCNANLQLSGNLSHNLS